MSIGAISSAISYYSLGSVSDYDLIKQKLIVLGVVPSGQESVDRAKLKLVEASQKSDNKSHLSTLSKGMARSHSPESLPSSWLELLSQLGITSSGDIDTDYEKAIAEIKKRLGNAKNEPEKEKYRILQIQIEKFVADFSSSQASASAMVGASALAAMNKASLNLIN